MTSTMMMERTGLGVPGYGVPGMGAPVTTPTGTPVGVNWMMVPRCTYKFEKATGGLKITCTCDDKTACGMVQNLCTMLAGGMCSVCCTMNGVLVYGCNLTMGLCKCEMTADGVSITCTSGDAKCCEMIQACCECLTCMADAGCTCCVMFNSTPVCCGGTDTTKTAKAKR